MGTFGGHASSCSHSPQRSSLILNASHPAWSSRGWVLLAHVSQGWTVPTGDGAGLTGTEMHLSFLSFIPPLKLMSKLYLKHPSSDAC